MKITDFIKEASELGLIQRPLTENEKDAITTAMIKEVQYCDDCGDTIKAGQGCAIAHLPCAISSANESESAFVCEACYKSIHSRSREVIIYHREPSW